MKPTDQELLDLYGWFKQASVGDVNTTCTRPGIFDLKAQYKWDNLNSRKGVSKEEAEKAYMELVQQLTEKYIIYRCVRITPTSSLVTL